MTKEFSGTGAAPPGGNPGTEWMDSMLRNVAELGILSHLGFVVACGRGSLHVAT